MWFFLLRGYGGVGVKILIYFPGQSWDLHRTIRNKTTAALGEHKTPPRWIFSRSGVQIQLTSKILWAVSCPQVCLW